MMPFQSQNTCISTGMVKEMMPKKYGRPANTVILNACYLKIMQDEDLKAKLHQTGDEPLIYVSEDNENLFGRALMEVRGEIRRLTETLRESIGNSPNT